MAFSFYSFFVLFLAATTVVSVPVAEDNLFKRRGTDKVCGMSFNQKDTFTKCSLDTVYERTNSTLVSKKSFANQKRPKGVNCHRVVGLWITQGVADKSGLCDIIDKWHKVDKNVTAESLLTPVRDHINDKKNVVFVDDKVDSRKASLVMSTLRGKKATKHDEKLNKAAKSYIDAVDGPAKDTAKAVDKDFADIVAKAQKRVDELFPKDKKHQKHSKEEKKFQEAVKKYKKSPTMEETWGKVQKAL